MARLKGVDRFIFGRGGEECLALWTADIDYEIVPGITSGLAAAACAIVPRTYRSISQSVLFVTGHKVAEFLETHPRVAWVSYAGLPSSPHHALARKYLPRGPGAVFTFGVRGGFAAGVKIVESVRLFSHLANVGDTRSLILHPASTTHRQLNEEQRQSAGAGDDVIRLSIGLESADDLIADLDQALGQT